MAGESKRETRHGVHLRKPVSLRLPEAEQAWVQATAEAEGMAKNAVVVRAVRRDRERAQSDPATTEDPKGKQP